MPQLDTLSFFSQYFYLLISFFSIYYYVATFIIPSTLTANKLRAKFNKLISASSSVEDLNLEMYNLQSNNLEPKSSTSYLLMLNLTLEALLVLKRKTSSVAAFEIACKLNKNLSYTYKSSLMFHVSKCINYKKMLLIDELRKV